MMKVLYLDCFSGISGDMCLGALIDAGADHKRLLDDLVSLPLYDWDMRVEKKTIHGITGTKVDIAVREDLQPHRSFRDIKNILEGCQLPRKAIENSLRIFERLAEAEGKVHGLPADKVHFHEVGGVDSIIDIVGTSLAMYYLEVDRVICSPVPTGKGTIECRHGILPVPAPATAELLKGIPLAGLDVEGELTTPTGAAIAAVMSREFGPLPKMRVESLGYGFGSKDYGIPNFLRVFTGISQADTDGYHTESVLVLETNIDDMNPEFTGYIMERLFQQKVLDVFISPAYMKKNRPGYLLTILCHPNLKDSVLQVLFEETSTLGIRWRQEQKTMLDRKISWINTAHGPVRIKYALSGEGAILKAAPEYEDCKKLAAEKGVPLRKVYEAALLKAKEEGGD